MTDSDKLARQTWFTLKRTVRGNQMGRSLKTAKKTDAKINVTTLFHRLESLLITSRGGLEV